MASDAPFKSIDPNGMIFRLRKLKESRLFRGQRNIKKDYHVIRYVRHGRSITVIAGTIQSQTGQSDIVS